MVALRFLGIGLILAAIAAAVFDATSTANTWEVAATRLGDLWAFAHPRNVDLERAATEQHLPYRNWDPGFQTVLRLPLWFVLALLGICFSLLGRRGQARDSAAAEQVKTPLAILLRGCGLGVLIISAALVVYALSQPMQLQSNVAFSTLGEAWNRISPESLDATNNMNQSHAPSLWDPWLSKLLALPALLIVALFGLGLYLMGARRRAAIRKDAEAETQPHGASSPPTLQQVSPGSELSHALSTCRGAFVSIGLFSGMTNILMLTGAFFMLQIYDRVLPSGSLQTLVALAVLVAGLFTILAVLDTIRSRILVRIGSSLDEALSARVYDTVVRLPLLKGNRGAGVQPLRDLDTVRAFLSGPGPTALFDLPWMPLYLVIIFSFHIWLGITAVIGAIVLVGMTLMTEALAREPMKAASGFAMTRIGLAEAGRRNAEVLIAMGMAGRMTARFDEANQGYKSRSQKASDVTGGFGSASKSLRMMLQSAVLGVGAYLVIHQEATAGIMIAAAILVARALAPVDLAIANWKGFLGARQSWKRLTEVLGQLPADEMPMALPAPTANLAVEHVSAVPPGGQKAVVHDVSLTLTGGQGLGIIGPSASGKSSLVRMIVGAWQPARGRIRLDGAALDQWSPEALGCHIGYLPQDVELFSGTVAENIARFEADAEPEAIIAAAQSAGVHDLIVGLPQGYETEIGELGQVLSAGQRQRIALARALYRDPFLVVLDEPNSNLDSDGEAALTQAISSVRKRGGIVIVVAHRPSALAAVDLVLVMANGGAVTFGPKDEVLSKVLAPTAVPRGPLSVVSDAGNKSS